MIPRLESTTERRKFEAFLDSVFRSPTEDAIRSHLHELRVPPPYRLRMKVLFSSVSAPELQLQLLASATVQRFDENRTAFRLRKSANHDGRGPGLSFALFNHEQPDIKVVVAVATTDQWVALLRELRRLYPALVPIYLSQSELVKAVHTLRQRRPDFELRVRELSAREALARGGTRRTRSVREWTDEALDDALLHVADRRQTLVSLQMAFYKKLEGTVDVSPATLCKVTKRSEIEASGSYTLAWSTVVDHIAEIGQRKLVFYSRRGLRERAYRPAPLAINFGSPVFEKVEEVRRLVLQLSKYPHSMHAVQHGNPYAHVRLSDRLDGSAFDVWAVSPERLVVVPRLRATAAAVERLVHYVFDSFREGEVSDFGS